MLEFDELTAYMTPSVKSVLEKINPIAKAKITEVRIRRNKPVVIVVRNASYFIDDNGELYDCLCLNSLCVGDKEFDELFYQLCNFSIYSNSENLKNGFITLDNGSRVGISSTAVYDENTLISVKDIMSLNIRVSRQIRGCADKLLNFLYVNSFPSIIISGAPNSGKTTLLRDIAMSLSNGFNNRYRKVCIVDERNEIAGKRESAYTMDVGVNTDVLTGFSKAKGIELAIRTMSPDFIVCDEISNENELDSIKFGFSAGVRFALSVHAFSKQELMNKTIVRELLDTNEFSYIIQLEGHSYDAEIIDVSEIYDEIHRNVSFDSVINRCGITII